MIKHDHPLPKAGPKQRRLRSIWFLIVAIGLMVGIAAAWTDTRTVDGNYEPLSTAIISGASISPIVAVVLIIGLILTMIVSIFYYRTIDEHDRSAQEHASLVALNFYIALSMAWEIGAKGNLVPPTNHVAIFLLVIGAFMADWLWRRYR